MSKEATEFRKLPLLKVVVGAFSLPWRHRAEVFRATAIPLLAVIACTLIADSANFTRIAAVLLIVLYGIATSWLAIAVHRLVLLDAPDSRASFDVQGLRRLAIFFGIVVGLWVIYQGLVMLISGAILTAFSPPGYISTGAERGKALERIDPESFEWMVNFARALSYWIVGRVALMLPAVAIDGKADLIAAWLASRRNGWRLAIVVGALPWSLQQLTNLLYRDGATMVEFGILVVLTTIFTVVEVVALSLSYWELTSPAPPPTHPPA